MESHVFEKIVIGLMVIAGISSIYIFIRALKISNPSIELGLIQMSLIIMLLMLIQTVILIRIFENTRK